jgi:hypothetical protein
MTEPKGAVYFVVPSPGTFGYEKGEWLVFAARDDQPKWWQLIARFTEECRAQLYAEIENSDLIKEADSVPAGLDLPPSALEKIAAAVKAGNIFAAPAEFVITGSPTPVIAASQVTALAELKQSKPAKAKSKKTNAHFPSDKWDESATNRLRQLRVAEDKPFGEIAQILNEEFPGRGYTKSACASKGDRLGLPLIPKSDPPEDEPVKSELESHLLAPDSALDSIGYRGVIEEAAKPEYDVSQLREAIHWYRSLRHVVYHYKNEGKIQVDHGERLSSAEFLAQVNSERERMSLPPFVEQQEAAD